MRKSIADSVLVPPVRSLLCQSARRHSLCGPTCDARRFHGAHITGILPCLMKKSYWFGEKANWSSSPVALSRQ